MNIFDLLYPTFKLTKPIRLFESFAGIGFQRMGLELAEIPYEVVGISEIDKFALQAYQAIHGECPNLGSITDIKGGEMPKDIDLFTYSFPCTDLSKAGKQKGLDNTRSGLVYEVLRILHELKEINNLPKVLIMENVVDLVQTKFIKEFNEIQSELEEIGYTNYTQTLNAKNYGIAQNRDRVFMVSILGEYNYNFPKGFELEHRLKDYLEEEVDESYYLSDDLLKHIEETGSKTTNFIQYDRYKGEFESLCRVWFGLSPTIHTKSNEIKVVENEDTLKQQELRPHLKIKEATKKGYAEAYDGDGVYINRPHQKRGVVQDGMIQTLKTSGNDVVVVVGSYDYGSSDNFMHVKSRLIKNPDTSNTIITSPNVGLAIEKNNDLRIRKLTPTETGRLMGMNDEQINKQLEVVSNSQAYKQHGNGIVAQVIGLIIGMMVYEDETKLRETIMKNSHTWLERNK